MVKLKENEKLEDLQCRSLKIIQDSTGYCFTTDSIVLANFAKVKHSDVVLEACSGSGVISFIIAAKQNPKRIVGLEIQQRLCDMSNRSVVYNNLQNSVSFLNISLQESINVFGNESFDVVVCNPPYNSANAKDKNLSQEIMIARHEIKLNLKELIEGVFKHLKYGGKFYLVHRADRLDEIFDELKLKNIAPKVVRFLHPTKNKNSHLVLIESIKGGKKGVKILPPLILNNDRGEVCQEIKQIYNS